jgi:hypothetical protein
VNGIGFADDCLTLGVLSLHLMNQTFRKGVICKFCHLLKLKANAELVKNIPRSYFASSVEAFADLVEWLYKKKTIIN